MLGQVVLTPYLHLNVRRVQDREQSMIYRLERRFFFFNSLITVVGLTCKTRAVSRTPLAFIAISMIYSLISGDCPA
jgi:uncharacterized membrane protein YhaH (DUF805 family)